MRSLLIALALLILPAAAMADVCHYCGGQGKVVRNVSSGSYGHSNDVKVKCAECGEVHWRSTGHSHIHCTHCSGTGVINRSGSGAYSRPRGSARERLNEIALENPAAYNAAMTIRYGLQIQPDEEAAIECLSDEGLRGYCKLRNHLNNLCVYANQGMALGYYRNTTPQQVQNHYNNVMKQFEADLSGFTSLVASGRTNYSPDVDLVLNRLCSTTNKTVEEYCKACAQFTQLNNLQEQIDNLRLMQNLF